MTPAEDNPVKPGGPSFDWSSALTLAGRNAWRTTITSAVGGFGGTHGGYIAALALRALACTIADARRQPRFLAVQLLEPVQPGPLTIQTQADRIGRSMAVSSLSMTQEGRTVTTASASFATSSPSISYLGQSFPPVPRPEACEPLTSAPINTGIGAFIDYRPAAAPLPLTGADLARIQVWMRLKNARSTSEAARDETIDPETIDPLLLATLLADSAPPALYARLDRPRPIPSASITLHYTGAGAQIARNGWVLGNFQTLHAGEGYAIEDGELWTPEGGLLLCSRQLRRILEPSQRTDSAPARALRPHID